MSRTISEMSPTDDRNNISFHPAFSGKPLKKLHENCHKIKAKNYRPQNVELEEVKKREKEQMVTDVANKDDYECEKNGDLLWLDLGIQ